MTAITHYPYAPRPPFHDWPQHYHDALHGFSAWHVPESGLLVTQVHASRADLDLSQSLGPVVYECLLACRRANAARGGMMVIHDWRTMTEIDSEARTDYAERLKGLRRGHVRGALMAIAPQRPLVRAAIHFATMVLPFRTGHKTTFVEGIDPLRNALLEFVNSPPSAEQPWPGKLGVARAS